VVNSSAYVTYSATTSLRVVRVILIYAYMWYVVDPDCFEVILFFLFVNDFFALLIHSVYPIPKDFFCLRVAYSFFVSFLCSYTSVKKFLCLVYNILLYFHKVF
jgi:hypothetical protein